MDMSFTDILSAVCDPVFVADREHHIVFVNDAYCRFTGFSRAVVLGKTAADFFPESEARIFHEKDDLVFSTGQANVNVEEYTDSAGVVHPIVTKKALYKAPDGATFLVGVIHDLTSIRLAQEELKKTHLFISSILENLPSMVFVKDAKDLKFVRINRAGEALLGVSRTELIGKNDYDFFPKEEADFFTDKDRQVLTGRQIVDIPEEVIHTRGKGERYLHTRKVPICNENGEPGYLLGISDDITEKRYAERALIESENRMSAVLDNTTAVIYIKDLDGRYLLVNRRHTELFGKQKQDVIGKTGLDIYPQNVARALMDNDQAVIRSGTPMEFEEEVPHDDGMHAYISNKFPIYDANGKVSGICGISTDITLWKKAEEVVREKAATDEKARFLSVASHELRTPLQSIREGIAVVLEGLLGTLNPEQTESLAIAARNVDRFTRLINNILDVQQLDMKVIPLERQTYDINELVLEVVRTMQGVARAKHLALETELSQELPLVLFYKDRLVQVLLNLVNNAVKYTERGGITLSTKRDNGGILICVRDSGIGIKDEDVPKLFKPFSQVGPSKNRSGSTGLGLAISKKIVDQFGGRIWVNPDPGGGSRFFLWLPVGSEPPPAHQ